MKKRNLKKMLKEFDLYFKDMKECYDHTPCYLKISCAECMNCKETTDVFLEDLVQIDPF